MTPEALRQWAATLRGDDQVALEATGNCDAIANLLAMRPASCVPARARSWRGLPEQRHPGSPDLPVDHATGIARPDPWLRRRRWWRLSACTSQVGSMVPPDDLGGTWTCYRRCRMATVLSSPLAVYRVRPLGVTASAIR